MTRRWRLATAGLLAAAAGVAGAAEPYTTIDGFATGPIDASRWASFERKREVIGDELHLLVRDGGLTTSNAGRAGISWGNDLTRPGKVTQLKARVRVKEIGLTGCAANPSPTRVRARLMGTFFNTGNRLAGSFYGDALAQIFLYRDSNTGDPAGQMRIRGAVNVCSNSDCSSSTEIGFADLGTANVDTNVLMVMEWDRSAKFFRFSRDNGVTFSTVPYTVDDSALPGTPLVSIGNRLDIANCQSGPRAFAHVDTRIDNVFVNTRGQP